MKTPGYNRASRIRVVDDFQTKTPEEIRKQERRKQDRRDDQANYRQRQKERGFIMLQTWVPATSLKKIKEFIREEIWYSEDIKSDG